MLKVLFVCTGNAARSVMAAAMTQERAQHVSVRSAGTLSISGLPMSQRTREALRSMGIGVRGHLSRQLEADDVDWAELILVFEPSHVRYIRAHHPEAAARTSSMSRLVRDLPHSHGPLASRIESLGLADVTFEDWEEVVDPAGGDQARFDLCAAELSELVDQFLATLPTSCR